MLLLIIGLVLFLGVHSVRVWGEPYRVGLIARMGEGPWKGLYSLASILGLALVVYGYGAARAEPYVLWASPTWARHLSTLVVLVAFVLFAAAYVPGNRLKATLGHPLALGAGLWAAAHLVANGTAADLLLFGGFLAWSTAVFVRARARDRGAARAYPRGQLAGDLASVGVGLVLWAVFAFYLHETWFGVSPFG